jgi:hypothetical protein
MNSLQDHNRNPDLFEVGTLALEGYPELEVVVPKPKNYGPVVTFLSRRIMRGQRPSAPYVDIIDGSGVLRKDFEERNPPVPVGFMTVREVHHAFASRTREGSLKRIYVGDGGFGVLEDPVSGTISPRKFSVYDIDLDEVHRVRLMDFPIEGTTEQAYEAADLEIAAGSSEIGLFEAKHHLYTSLAVLTKMMPPLPRDIS